MANQFLRRFVANVSPFVLPVVLELLGVDEVGVLQRVVVVFPLLLRSWLNFEKFFLGKFSRVRQQVLVDGAELVDPEGCVGDPARAGFFATSGIAQRKAPDDPLEHVVAELDLTKVGGAFRIEQVAL